MSIPYESATSGEKAIAEIQRILSKFGCQTFGSMTDADRGMTIIQFKWKEKQVSLEASWKGYAVMWIKSNPHGSRMRCTRQEHEARALNQAKISVCSILRDWVKGQTMAVECGIMSFEAAFMPHMLLPNGQRVIDRVQTEILGLPNS